MQCHIKTKNIHLISSCFKAFTDWQIEMRFCLTTWAINNLVHILLWQVLDMHWPWCEKVKGHGVMKCAVGMSIWLLRFLLKLATHLICYRQLVAWCVLMLCIRHANQQQTYILRPTHTNKWSFQGHSFQPITQHGTEHTMLLLLLLLLLLFPFNGPFSRTTWVSRYQKGGTIVDFTKARDGGVAMASAAPYANYLHFTPGRQPHQHLITQFLQARCSSCHATNSLKALKTF